MAAGSGRAHAARAVEALARAVGALGRYVADDESGEVVLRVSNDARVGDLLSDVEGVPVRYELSRSTPAGLEATMHAVTEVPRGAARGSASFDAGYDARGDCVEVRGYFRDTSIPQRMREIPGVVVFETPLLPPARQVAPTAGWANATLAAWAAFPVRATPRPIILLDEWSRCPMELDWRIKRSFFEGAVESRIALPHGVLSVLTKPRMPASGVAPVQVTAIDAVSAPFKTDRGPRELPAFNVRVAGCTETCCTVLDPSVAIWWKPASLSIRPTSGCQVERAQIEPDDLTLRLIVEDEDRAEFLWADIAESATTVVASPVTRIPPASTQLISTRRTMTVTLAAPLGNRVLVDSHANPVRVVPAGAEPRPEQAPPPPL